LLAERCPAVGETCTGGAQTLNENEFTMVAGCYNATDLNTVDTDLNSDNILSGVEIFGITGTASSGSTTLIWSTQRLDGFNWDAVLGWCAEMNLPYVMGDEEYPGWRLPTIEELYANRDLWTGEKLHSVNPHPGWTGATYYLNEDGSIKYASKTGGVSRMGRCVRVA
jgi:hypothetical protein